MMCIGYTILAGSVDTGLMCCWKVNLLDLL